MRSEHGGELVTVQELELPAEIQNKTRLNLSQSLGGEDGCGDRKLIV